MSAITVSRKLGSYGGRIAERVAQEMGWKFADRFFVDAVISEYGLIHLEEFYDKPPTLLDLFNENTAMTIEWMNKTVATLAAKYDVVILGRGGFAALKGYSDVFNVLVTAPDETRVKRVIEDNKVSRGVAQEMVERDTDTKKRFVRRYYGQNWADEDSYDLVVDTAEMSQDEAVQQIIEAAKARFGSGDGPKIGGMEVDRLLFQTIEDHFDSGRSLYQE
ncbi:MAG TPA: cytidylate kinase-like family protein [Propionibacterium sp.]|nr:cytidylate kinase-like family protein [Propionibacterium sp.]